MPEDIDEQNHVNNTVYLRWVQEVATAHWEAIASSEAQEGIGWVVLRQEIASQRTGLLGDDVVLRTWVGKATLFTFANGSLKSEAAAMASYCHPREHSGARSMRKPAGQSESRRKCASSFRFEFRCARFSPLPCPRGEDEGEGDLSSKTRTGLFSLFVSC